VSDGSQDEGAPGYQELGASGRHSIPVGEHPARRLVAVLAIFALGFLAVAIFRPDAEDAAAALAPHLGQSLRLVIRTEPGAAPDDREWLEPVTLEEIAEHDGAPAARLRLEGMSPIDRPGAPARLWIPLERVLEVWIGGERIYRRDDG
jgi:hypothetical protein